MPPGREGEEKKQVLWCKNKVSKHGKAFRDPSEVLLPVPTVTHLWKPSDFIISNRSVRARWETAILKTGTAAVFQQSSMWFQREIQHWSWIPCKFLQVPTPLPVPVVWCSGLEHAVAPRVAHDHDNPKPRVPLRREVLSHERERFSTFSSVSYEWKLCNSLRLVQFGAVHLLVCTGTRELFAVSCVWTRCKHNPGLLHCCSLRHSFFRKAIREEQQRILPRRKGCGCLASSQN